MKRSRIFITIPGLRTIFVLLAIVLAITTTRAATYTVNSLADPGDGTCNATECTLREAMTQANSNGGGDTINFTVNGTVNLASELPHITIGVSIVGPGAGLLTIRRDSGGDYTVFTIDATAIVVLVNISGLTISNGNGPTGGGIVFEHGFLNVINCTISGNSAPSGGGMGIYSRFARVINSTISGNIATGEGGDPGYGGGIFSDSADLRISSSTLSGNQAKEGGGGIANFGVASFTNSTLANNSTAQCTDDTCSGTGGAMLDFGESFIYNSTVSGNSAKLHGGGIEGVSGQTFLRSSIVALNNTSSHTGPNLFGIFVNLQYNVVGWIDTDLEVSFTPTAQDHIGVTAIDLNLGPLADNGGPTQTMAIGPGSVALDAGLSAGLTTDQRGLARDLDYPTIPNPAGGDGTDAGAFELRIPGFKDSATIVDHPADTQYSDLVTLRSTTTVDSGSRAGNVDFYVNGFYWGSRATDSQGRASLNIKLNQPAGTYSILAVFTSSRSDVLVSRGTNSINVLLESATVAPVGGNPASMPASVATGVANGTTAPICFNIAEVPDGFAGNTGQILFLNLEITSTGVGDPATVVPSDITLSGGGNGVPRSACFTLAQTDTAIDVYTMKLTLDTSVPVFYSGMGSTTFTVFDPANRADLSLGLGVSNNAPRQGDLVTYTVTVRNFGPSTAVNTVINDLLSSGTTFVSARANKGTFTAPASGQSGPVTWWVGNLANNGQESAQIDVTVIVGARSNVTNTASVSTDITDPNSGNNAASITTTVITGGGKK
jgi:uncharacterized repeat protein (TIGR01451 family)/CSLREA domain-containing protein